MTFSRVFEIIWAIGAIGLGGGIFWFTEWFVKNVVRWDSWLYKKTQLSFYRLQGQEMIKPYMKVFTKVVGLVFVILGITLLLGKWHTGQ